MINVFDYLNYRIYLRDLFQEKKKEKSQFSQKYVLAELGVTSTGFMSNIMAGRKNLTPAQTNKLCIIIGFDKPQSRYFECMVYYTQAKTIEDKNEFLSKLMALQKIKMKTLDSKFMSLFAKWYYVFLRELLENYNYKGENEEENERLGDMLIPELTPEEVKEGVEYLEQLGLIEKDDEGCLRPKDNAISTGDEVKSLHLLNFQMETMELAKKALERIPAEERDISFLSMSLSNDNFGLIKNEIQYFRKRIAKIAVDENNPQNVYQLNFQFFPVTKDIQKAKKRL